MRMSAVFGAKNFRIFKIYGVSARTRGELSSCGHFVGKGSGQFFVILYGSILCGRSLIANCLKVDVY